MKPGLQPIGSTRSLEVGATATNKSPEKLVTNSPVSMIILHSLVYDSKQAYLLQLRKVSYSVSVRAGLLEEVAEGKTYGRQRLVGVRRQ